MTHAEAIASLKFKDEQHQSRFESLRGLYISDPDGAPDPYREALAYLLALTDDTYNHRNSLYDTETGCIIPDGIDAMWQTSTSLKVTRLAFNLFTAGTGWCHDDELHLVTPDAIFDSNLSQYFAEAVKLRMYPVYE